MIRSSKQRGWIAAALAAGLLLRLLFVFRYAHILGDSLVYGDIARNLLTHGIYGFSNLPPAPPRPTLIRLPGYPLLLAAIFRIFGLEHYTAVMLVQTALDLGSCLLLMGVAGRLFGQRAGMAALWLGALCPFTANYVAAPLTETPTLFCIAAAFYGLVRWRAAGASMDRWLVIVAAALAWAILLRPEQGMLAAAVVPAMVWTRWSAPGSLVTRMRPVLLASILTLLPLVPWTARNWHTFHTFQPLAPRFANDPGESTPFGFQRWYRTWAIDFASTDDCYWQYDGNSIDIADLPNRAFDSNAQYEQTALLLDDYNDNQVATPALDLRWNALAHDRIAADPLRYYLWMPMGRVLNMAFRPRTENLEVPLEWWKFTPGHRRAATLAWGYGALNLAYFVLAAVGIYLRKQWWPHRVVIAAMLATILFRVMLLLTIDNSEMRYTLEFYPVLIVMAALTLGSMRLRKP